MIPEQALTPLGLDQATLIWQSFVWIAVIIAIFAPLAVRQYRRSVG
ncbi:MAG TPA: hypothetical protein VMM14_07905 [Acidimicrobiia bacterium]|nr:hypothetical protein [Acidimicrobiia bacterium]